MIVEYTYTSEDAEHVADAYAKVHLERTYPRWKNTTLSIVFSQITVGIVAYLTHLLSPDETIIYGYILFSIVFFFLFFRSLPKDFRKRTKKALLKQFKTSIGKKKTVKHDNDELIWHSDDTTTIFNTSKIKEVSEVEQCLYITTDEGKEGVMPIRVFSSEEKSLLLGLSK